MPANIKIKYDTFPPPPDLAPYVRFFWVLEGEGVDRSEAPFIYRSMADGCAELLFHYSGIFDELKHLEHEKSFTSGIHGQSQRFRRFLIRENFGIFGAYLYPFALPLFFSLPASEVSNEMVDLKTFPGNQGRELEEKIMLAKNQTERVDILSAFLKKRLSQNQFQADSSQEAIRQIIQEKGQINISQLADNHYLSIRQFLRKFKEIAGFSPKLYTRIIRFNAAMNTFGNTYRNLAEIAYECGYYDQSHFIHDFKEFSGYHPLHYFSGKAEDIEWREE